MSEENKQDEAYEAAVRVRADTIDSEPAHDMRYLIAKLDASRMLVRDLQQRLSEPRINPEFLASVERELAQTKMMMEWRCDKHQWPYGYNPENPEGPYCVWCERIAAETLLKACKDLFAMMDENLLVRNVINDHKPDFAVASVNFVMRLKSAHSAILEAEKAKP